MQIESHCEAHKVLQLQGLVKQFNLRWMFNPYPVIANLPHGKWKVGIDYNNTDVDHVKRFDQAWQRIETPIIESSKKYSIVHKLKVWAKQIL